VITKSDKKTAEGRSSSYQETVTASVSREDDDDAEFEDDNEEEEDPEATATPKLKAVTKVRFFALGPSLFSSLQFSFVR
jgi:hypothetical protein